MYLLSFSLIFSRYMIQDDREGPLVSMDVRDFIMTVGSRSPSPGGGSVSAFAASLVSVTLIFFLKLFFNLTY